MTDPRIVARGGTYAVTRRCVCRKAFLGWWSEEVDEIWLWCLALAAAKCGVWIHHAVRVGNHYHLTLTLSRENLGEFLWWLNRSLSCALNTLLCKEGYDAPRELFDGRGTHVMRLMDAEAQLASLVYGRLNVPKAGLAETCDGVPGRPGATLPPALWKTRGIGLEKPRTYFKSGPAGRRLGVTPPPLLYLAFGGDVDALVHHMDKLERAGERAIRDARQGRPAMTPDEVRAIHPWDEPRTARESGGGRVPCFKAGSPLGRLKGAVEVRGWRQQYREAERRWAAGERDVEFPAGTYEMRRRFGVTVAEAGDDAWVSAPGVTLDEAREMVGERDPTLVDRVREVLVEQLAGDLEGEDEAVDVNDDTAEVPARPVPRERPVAEVKHRFSKRRATSSETAPRRLIVLRDRRRGRRGGDPPGE